jgi:hypothetical protein
MRGGIWDELWSGVAVRVGLDFSPDVVCDKTAEFASGEIAAGKVDAADTLIT